MTTIAASYESATAREANLQLAADFRLPYWDVFRTRYIRGDKSNSVQGLSVLFAVTNINVIPVNGKDFISIRNPLYSYTYPDRKGDGVKAAFPVGSNRTACMDFLAALSCDVTTRHSPSEGSPISNSVQLQATLSTGTADSAGMNPATGKWNSSLAYDATTFDQAGLKAKLYACLTASTGTDSSSSPPLPYQTFATNVLEGALMVKLSLPLNSAH